MQNEWMNDVVMETKQYRRCRCLENEEAIKDESCLSTLLSNGNLARAGWSWTSAAPAADGLID